ncbi:putative uncharacterized protein DDB_G0277255 [Pecten maximus]|uniref:putative uncharacterized protein DDB_G0277255 n=1 Tax=Pecten maximus TaxID=6579 RepID=UPI0014588A33|nr:putative uncharacterized protein DDB_G0277255 [Pecten maximus]
MLLLVVVLNVIDCALVLGELVLDLHHVKDILSHSQKTSSVFLQRLQASYPENIVYTDTNDLKKIYEQILRAKIDWEFVDDVGSSTTLPYTNINATETRPNTTHGSIANDSLTLNSGQMHMRVKRSAGGSSSCDFPVTVSGLSSSVSIEERVANALHKTSLFIVCVLIVETLLKMFCFGKQFFEHKIEVFDAFIVLISFVVDLIFLEGLSAYSLEDFVYILAFILPWGVIRVVNSLVVVVRDHEHFRLKLLYTQKKKVDSDNKNLRQEKEKLSDQVDSLRRLCLGEGVDDFRIQQSMTRSSSRPGKGIMGSFASLAMGAIGGGKSNGTSFWNLLNTPKLKRGKSEEWEGKLGVSKVDSHSMRFNERLWTVSGISDMKKAKKSQSLTQQGTTESDPGTPPTIRGRLKALKRLLKRQETVDSYSSTETIDKNSRFSLDRLSSSDNITPLQSVDIESVTDMETGDEGPGRLSLSPYDVINECMEDKLEEGSIVGDATQNRPSKTNIIVTTCSTDDCDSLTFSTGGSKDSLKSRTSGGRTMEIAVDIEYSDSEIAPMLLQDPEVPSAAPIDPSSPDHKQILNPNSETDITLDRKSTHVGHLPSLDCGHHSHSYNCIPNKAQHKNYDAPHGSVASRKRSMPSNSAIGESGLPSGIFMQQHPVKRSSDPDITPSIERPTLPDNILISPNGSSLTKGLPLPNPWHHSNSMHLLDTAVPASRIHLPNIISQSIQTNNTGSTLYTTSDISSDNLSYTSPVNTPLSGTVNSTSRTPLSTADISVNKNIAGMSSTTNPKSQTKFIPSNGSQSVENKPSPMSTNRTPSMNSNTPFLDSNQTSPQSGNTAISNLLNIERTPSPKGNVPPSTNNNNNNNNNNNICHSPTNSTPSPNNRSPSPNNNRSTTPSRTPSPLQNCRIRSPNSALRNSTPSRSPSAHRSPSPSGFVSVHTSNNDITSGFQPIQIPETHFDSPHLPLEPLIRETPSNVNMQQNSNDNLDDIQHMSTENHCHTLSSSDDNSCHSPCSSDNTGHPQSFSDNPGHYPCSSDNTGHPQSFSDNPGHSPCSSDNTGHSPCFSDNPGHSPCSSDNPGHSPCSSDNPGHSPCSSDNPGHSPCSSDTPGHSPCSSDSSCPNKVSEESMSNLVQTNCPGKDILQNRNNTFHHPSRAFNSAKQLELPDTIKTRLTDMSHKSLDQFSPSLPSDLAPQRRSSMH